MGLVLIMLLVVMGVLFSIAYILNDTGTDYEEQFLKDTLAGNTLDAILNTRTTCNDLTITQLLQDCAKSGSLRCGTQYSCEYVEDTITILLNQTLGSWKKPYYFKAGIDAKTNSNQMTDPITIGRDCEQLPGRFYPEPQTRTRGFSGKSIDITLDICYRIRG